MEVNERASERWKRREKEKSVHMYSYKQVLSKTHACQLAHVTDILYLKR